MSRLDVEIDIPTNKWTDMRKAINELEVKLIKSLVVQRLLSDHDIKADLSVDKVVGKVTGVDTDIDFLIYVNGDFRLRIPLFTLPPVFYPVTMPPRVYSIVCDERVAMKRGYTYYFVKDGNITRRVME